MTTDDRIFNRQFLLTSDACALPDWRHVRVSGYHLYVHPNLQMTIASNTQVELILLGYFFDYRNPEKSNDDILITLAAFANFDDLLLESDELSGRFVLIYKAGNTFRIFHDACGQREVYYDDTFTAFGSQPRLLEKVVTGVPHSDPEANDFYRSSKFIHRKVFIGDTTHRQNIRHLRPNHYIDVLQKNVQRYFPNEPLQQMSTSESAAIAADMLKRYLSAAEHRYRLRMGVTAGYDSRVLFLASLGLNCNYQVSKINEKHNEVDIAIAQQLVSMHGKTLTVGGISSPVLAEDRLVQDLSIDFPHYKSLGTPTPDSLLINGNISEIARNFYGSLDHPTATDLVFFEKYQGDPFVTRVFNDWIERNSLVFSTTGYHVLDMFYWEERMGNWAAKNKTESDLSREVYSPFCARRLLMTLLATTRKDRDTHFNKLYDTIIGILSPQTLQLQINPTPENKRIRVLKRTGLYPVLKYLAHKKRNFGK